MVWDLSRRHGTVRRARARASRAGTRPARRRPSPGPPPGCWTMPVARRMPRRELGIAFGQDSNFALLEAGCSARVPGARPTGQRTRRVSERERAAGTGANDRSSRPRVRHAGTVTPSDRNACTPRHSLAPGVRDRVRRGAGLRRAWPTRQRLRRGRPRCVRAHASGWSAPPRPTMGADSRRPSVRWRRQARRLKLPR